jgi:hypothetical protein
MSFDRVRKAVVPCFELIRSTASLLGLGFPLVSEKRD